MPRDITHFLVAEHVQAALQPEPFWQPILRNTNCLKAGAVFPDALYYLAMPCHNPAIKAFSDTLHGTDGQDTFVIVKQILKTLPHTSIKEQLLAFLVGIVTHIFADMTFHPLVYFLTGNTRDPDKITRGVAVQKHRQLETLIDIYLCGGLDHVDSYPLASYLHALEAEQALLFWEAARGFFSDGQKDEVIHAMSSAYKTFVLAQSVCTLKVSRCILAPVDRLLPRHLKTTIALLYAPRLELLLGSISGSLSYRHPLSGEPYETTLQHLFQQAVTKSVECCHMLEKIIVDKMSVGELPVGSSLELAVPGVAVTEMRYFAPRDIFGL